MHVYTELLSEPNGHGLPRRSVAWKRSHFKDLPTRSQPNRIENPLLKGDFAACRLTFAILRSASAGVAPASIGRLTS